MNFRLVAVTALAAIGVTAISAPAQAVTFADYSAVSSASNMNFTSAATGGTLGASAETLFNFLTLGSAYQNLSAAYTFNASSTAAAISAGGYDIQPGLGGSFAFTYDGPNAGALSTGENLLSGTFAGASLAGPDSGSTATTQDSIFSGGSVTYASDVLSFSPAGDKGLSIELTSLLPGLFFSHGSLASFTGVSTGSFASDTAGGGGGGVPEPASWALMLLGVAGIGCASRLSMAAQRKALA